MSTRFYLMKVNGDSNVIDVNAAIFDLRDTFPQLLWCISIVHESYKAFYDTFMVLFWTLTDLVNNHLQHTGIFQTFTLCDP